jgi:hypothetical protein
MTVKDLKANYSPVISASRRKVVSTFEQVVSIGKIHAKDLLECKEKNIK